MTYHLSFSRHFHVFCPFRTYVLSSYSLPGTVLEAARSDTIKELTIERAGRVLSPACQSSLVPQAGWDFASYFTEKEVKDKAGHIRGLIATH